MTVAPAPHFVAEPPRAAEEARSDGALAHRTSVGGRVVPDGSHLDDVPRAVDAHFERRVVEVACTAMLVPCGDCLEHPAVEADTVTASTERQPVEGDRRLVRCRCGRVRQPRAAWLFAMAESGAGSRSHAQRDQREAGLQPAGAEERDLHHQLDNQQHAGDQHRLRSVGAAAYGHEGGSTGGDRDRCEQPQPGQHPVGQAEREPAVGRCGDAGEQLHGTFDRGQTDQRLDGDDRSAPRHDPSVECAEQMPTGPNALSPRSRSLIVVEFSCPQALLRHENSTTSAMISPVLGRRYRRRPDRR